MALIDHLHNFVRMPETAEERQKVALDFFNYRNAHFPRTIGAIDCTHVKIQSPGGESSETFRNRKGYFSLNVQTIASPDLKVRNIVARWPGSVHDQTIFRNSQIYQDFANGNYGRYILVGDSGYANTPFLATPFTARNPNVANNLHMQRYQNAIITTRNVVERQYGVLKRRFPALSLGLRVNLQTAMKVIVAAAILHNICIEANEPVPPIDPELEAPPQDIEDNDEVPAPRPQGGRRQHILTARDEIVEIFRNRN